VAQRNLIEPSGKARYLGGVETEKVTMVACHPGDLPRGTVRAIIAQTGLTADEFLK